jgi:hypothetical protein
MSTVWKYPLPDDWRDTFDLDMPAGAQVLAVQVQHGHPCIWALVDPSASLETRLFRIAGTGHPITEALGRHVGTFQMLGGDVVFHVFEVQP